MPPRPWKTCLGVPDAAVTKDRLYRTLDDLLQAQEPIENDLKEQFGALFHLDYDLLLYDLTSTYFEGLAEENDLARRGYSRDHRSDCKQIVLALVVTREGFPLAHYTLAGNTQDLQTVETIVTAVEKRFGTAQRVWVMDRGMISKETLAFLAKSPRSICWRRGGRKWRGFRSSSAAVAAAGGASRRRGQAAQARRRDLSAGPEQAAAAEGAGHPPPAAAGLGPGLAPTARADRRGPPEEPRQDPRTRRPTQGPVPQGDSLRHDDRRQERACPAGRLLERRQVQGRPGARRRLPAAQQSGRLVGRGVLGNVHPTDRGGACLPRAQERALLRPVWHHYSGRVQAHVFICVLAYALWKTLDHLAKQAGLETQIRKPDPKRPKASPKDRPMTPEVILRELAKIQIGDILLETTEGQQLVLRRVARPDAEQKRILAALQLEIPERLSPDRLL